METVYNINRKILKTIENSDYDEEVKELLRALLTIELNNYGDSHARYSEDYDRQIIKAFEKQKTMEKSK